MCCFKRHTHTHTLARAHTLWSWSLPLQQKLVVVNKIKDIEINLTLHWNISVCNLFLSFQIPPPKPPPPEMHFIPNPSNTEFIYLVGLEHVVDFLTKDTKSPMPLQPFCCSQCQCDFTPVWKWEARNKGGRGTYVMFWKSISHLVSVDR